MRLIDADALLQRAVAHGWSTPKWVSNIVIEDAPTIEAEPIKHGRWETTRPDAPMFGFYYCSECGRRRTSPQDNYCPNCGAKMDLTE